MTTTTTIISTKPKLMQLPNELLVEIISHLEPKERYTLRRMCRRLRDVIPQASYRKPLALIRARNLEGDKYTKYVEFALASIPLAKQLAYAGDVDHDMLVHPKLLLFSQLRNLVQLELSSITIREGSFSTLPNMKLLQKLVCVNDVTFAGGWRTLEYLAKCPSLRALYINCMVTTEDYACTYMHGVNYALEKGHIDELGFHMRDNTNAPESQEYEITLTKVKKLTWNGTCYVPRADVSNITHLTWTLNVVGDIYVYNLPGQTYTNCTHLTLITDVCFNHNVFPSVPNLETLNVHIHNRFYHLDIWYEMIKRFIRDKPASVTTFTVIFKNHHQVIIDDFYLKGLIENNGGQMQILQHQSPNTSQ